MNLINVENITKTYTERKLFEHASFSLQEGEKVGVIGINGTGKTTLLKMLAGQEEPDEGTITTANHVVIRYLPQHPEFDPAMSSLECVLEGNGTDENRWTIESDAKAMMTRLGIKDFNQPAGQLSGGERKRLALISALLSPADILLLDEPTNHLDIGSCQALEDALQGYDGTLFVVSHDRYLINKLADRLYVLGKDGAKLYPGNYDYYLEKRQEEAEAAPREEAAPKVNLYKLRKERESELRKKRTALTRVEGQIEENDRERAALAEKLEQPEVAADYQAVTQTSQEIAALEAQGEALLQQWTQLSEELEALEEAARELDS